MKKIFSIFATVLLTAIMFLPQQASAQTPQKISYQAVIRNNSGVIVANHAVGVKISILKGSSTGTPVYSQTQTQTTDSSGLISIEIGGGTGFNTIAWANDAYFAKTEVDPAGGSNYSIMGTSQFLSVPYALQANTSSGVVNMTQLQIDALTPNSGLMVYNSTSKELNIYDGTIWKSLNTQPVTPFRHSVGESFQGGTIFYVDTTGMHGLIAAPSDQSGYIKWCIGTTYTSTGATATAIGTGNANTNAIIASQGTSASYAAKLCADLVLNGYSDWYLPSKDELVLLYQRNVLIGGFNLTTQYWSSTEVATTNNNANTVNFSNGVTHYGNLKSYSWSVRAIRSF